MAFSQTIEIIDISAPADVKTAKGGYKVIEVAYKNDGKVEGKKLLSFQNEAVFKKIQQFKRGDVVDIVKDKDKNDYWQWTSVESSTTAAPASGTSGDAAPSRNAGSNQGTGRVTGSNYETPDERKLKQRYIVRQSAINAALKYIELAKIKPNALEDVLPFADVFVNYVYSEEPIQEVIDMPDDIPL